MDNRGDMDGVVDMNGAEGGGIWIGLEDMDWMVDINGAEGWGMWIGDEGYGFFF